jgi:Kef-type K+ transport system membrane component KefB
MQENELRNQLWKISLAVAIVGIPLLIIYYLPGRLKGDVIALLLPLACVFMLAYTLFTGKLPLRSLRSLDKKEHPALYWSGIIILIIFLMFFTFISVMYWLR